MSQQTTPLNGGTIPQIETTATQNRLLVLSQQYIETKGLQSRPTEWIPGGRPIYRRLPGTSETYQINFFNVVNESNILGNTRNLKGIDKVGFVYTPFGASINGPFSSEVVTSDNDRNLLIHAGTVIWEYGKTEQPPTIVNLEVLDVGSGSYDVAYQLVYDDAPLPKLYEVSDFALTGLPLTITSSTDSVIGWRYGSVNAFLNDSVNFWAASDTLFPAYAQPATAYLQWGTDLGQAYTKVILRCSTDSVNAESATLSYVDGVQESVVQTISVSSDSEGQFYEFLIASPVFQQGWKVSFSSTTVHIQSIAVSGQVTLEEPQSTPSPRAALAMYPAGSLPKEIINSQGEKKLATYCQLAIVDVDNNFTVTRVQDTRSIIHRDYTPVADWLTKPFDEDLINIYEQVTGYPTLWMAPTSCMRQEYGSLTKDKITVKA
jgi:hypothetical protein